MATTGLRNRIRGFTSPIPSLRAGLQSAYKEVTKFLTSWFDYTAAAPGMRHLDPFTVVPLYTKDVSGKRSFVGSFLPEFYDLANTPDGGSLQCQILEKEWIEKKLAEVSQNKWNSLAELDALRAHYKDLLFDQKPDLHKQLYHADPNKGRKKPFELAVADTLNELDIEALAVQEYEFRTSRQLPLPRMVSPLWVAKEYFQNREAAGIFLGTDTDPETGVGDCNYAPFKLKPTIKNPKATQTRLEQLLHFSGQWSAFLIAVAAAVTVGYTSPWVFVVMAAGVYISKSSVQHFFHYDAAEELYRNLALLRAPELMRGKFSLRNTITTLFKLAFAGVAAFGAAIATWSLVLTPFAPISLIPSLAVSTLQIGLAGFLSTASGLSVFAGFTSALRFVNGLSVTYTEIPFGDAAKRLDPVRGDDRFLTSPNQDENSKQYQTRAKLVFQLDFFVKCLEQVVQDRDQVAKKLDQVAKERDQLTQERDQLARQRDQAAKERDQAARRLAEKDNIVRDAREKQRGTAAAPYVASERRAVYVDRPAAVVPAAAVPPVARASIAQFSAYDETEDGEFDITRRSPSPVLYVATAAAARAAAAASAANDRGEEAEAANVDSGLRRSSSPSL